MEFDLEYPSIGLQSDTIPSLFASESDHMPSDSYIQSFKSKDFDLSTRQQAISFILNVQFSSDFDPFIPYLAVNYLDRFLSKHRLPQGKQWILELVCISCLSLAAKMKKTEFSLNDFGGEDQLIFNSETIQRMELLILGVLEWRLRSITPFSFIHFFLSLFKLKDPALMQSLKARASEILFNAQNEVELLGFKPSIIAASALLSASHELFPLQFPCFRDSISSSAYVNKEELFGCCDVMEDLLMESYESVFDMESSSNTPVNVLDRHWSSSESEMTMNMTMNRVSMKRRKVNDLCSESGTTTTFQFSQSQHWRCN